MSRYHIVPEELRLDGNGGRKLLSWSIRRVFYYSKDEERRLEGVLRRILVPEHPAAHREHRPPVPPDKQFESRPVPVERNAPAASGFFLRRL